MLSHLGGVREGADIEAVHDMRVWSRRLVASMTRISNQFEKDPARFLLNDRSKGVDTP